MIKEYMFSSDNASELEIISKDDFNNFLKKEVGFLFNHRLREFHIVIGVPLGIGENKINKSNGPLYNIYGIVTQLRNGFLFGRKIPSSLKYDVTLKEYKKRYVSTLHYAVSNDVRSKTSDLIKNIAKDHRKQVSGLIIDKKEKLIILTSVIPSVMKSQKLEPVDN